LQLARPDKCKGRFPGIHLFGELAAHLRLAMPPDDITCEPAKSISPVATLPDGCGHGATMLGVFAAFETNLRRERQFEGDRQGQGRPIRNTPYIRS
jgi:hypothetical protein